MKTFSLRPLVTLAAVIATALVAGCVSTASDGRYQTNPRGGWDNFRAETPAAEPRQVSVA
ncbi:MAG TPA: hypothetical protein VF949_00735 [Reyranella sp.]|jgi:hypothetical protein